MTDKVNVKVNNKKNDFIEELLLDYCQAIDEQQLVESLLSLAYQRGYNDALFDSVQKSLERIES